MADDPEPLTGPVPERDLSDPAVRARYYIEITACRGCHSSWYSDLFPGPYAGGKEIVDSVFSTNITPDVSGIGGWSEERFVEIMRTGKGGTLDAAMPWVVFGRMSDEDLGRDLPGPPGGSTSSVLDQQPRPPRAARCACRSTAPLRWNSRSTRKAP